MKDHLIASVIIFGALGWAVLATLVVAFFKGANRPAPRRLPGALGDSVRGEDDYYERLRTPGMGDPFAAPTSFREVEATQPPAVVETLDAARLRRSGS